MPDQNPESSLNPYPLTLDHSSGIYTFLTDHQLEYQCIFTLINSRLSPILGVYDIEVFEFDFYYFDSQERIRIPKDERVSLTIKQLIKQFFKTPNRILVYVCDSLDGRGIHRQSLFRRWHLSTSDIFQRYELEIELEGHENIYGAVVTPTDFPHQDILQNHVVDQANGIMLEKYGR